MRVVMSLALLLVVLASACYIEPEDMPPRIWNELDVPVDIYESAEDGSDALLFVVRIEPGDVFEWNRDTDGRCVERDLTALVEDRVVSRFDADDWLCINDLWGVFERYEQPADS